MRENTEKLSGQHNQGRLAIIIDGKLIMAPLVRGVVADSVVIAGNFRQEDVEQLAASLNASRQ